MKRKKKWRRRKEARETEVKELSKAVSLMKKWGEVEEKESFLFLSLNLSFVFLFTSFPVFFFPFFYFSFHFYWFIFSWSFLPIFFGFLPEAQKCWSIGDWITLASNGMHWNERRQIEHRGNGFEQFGQALIWKETKVSFFFFNLFWVDYLSWFPLSFPFFFLVSDCLARVQVVKSLWLVMFKRENFFAPSQKLCCSFLSFSFSFSSVDFYHTLSVEGFSPGPKYEFGLLWAKSFPRVNEELQYLQHAKTWKRIKKKKGVKDKKHKKRKKNNTQKQSNKKASEEKSKKKRKETWEKRRKKWVKDKKDTNNNSWEKWTKNKKKKKRKMRKKNKNTCGFGFSFKGARLTKNEKKKKRKMKKNNKNTLWNEMKNEKK